MNNISWSKTIGNWGANESEELKVRSTSHKTKEPKISPEEAKRLKEDILLKCDVLLQSAAQLYEKESSKELYDALVTIDMSLASIKKLN